MTTETWQILKLFFASPDDLAEERQAAGSAVEEYNENYFHHHGYHVRVLSGGDASLGRGCPHPQGRINPLVDSCHLFVAVFGARLGSPTGVDESGSVEEYHHALAGGCDVHIYFCDYLRDNPSAEDHERRKLENFRKRLGKDVLYRAVESKADFLREFKTQLANWFRAYIGRGGKEKLCVPALDRAAALSGDALSAKFRAATKGF